MNSHRIVILICYLLVVQWTLDLQTAWLTDFLSYRLLWPQNLGLICRLRFDLQTRKKPKWPVTGLIGFQCTVGQWRLDLRTFWLENCLPIRIKFSSQDPTVFCRSALPPLPLSSFALVLMGLGWIVEFTNYHLIDMRHRQKSFNLYVKIKTIQTMMSTLQRKIKIHSAAPEVIYHRIMTAKSLVYLLNVFLKCLKWFIEDF